ncbi:hypothetical protein [Umezawaea sp. Da 62-37]|uniref:hypothetical protein n=1 Tax=Umezawaea sp. Da 62-37 TaxID=3075927 RepID=UPI0028F71084|nr:hypothetical protein [Umezawaea sp. Da 62-37]WNV81933.1 hypothetical protein RM788_27340 [Umezawaea sp. Da 62-37]
MISVGAVAVVMGLALGIGLSGSSEEPRDGSGNADPRGGGDQEPGQSGGDLPPMDFEGKVVATASSRVSKTVTTIGSPTSSAGRESSVESEPRRTEESVSAVRLTSTPELPALPSVPSFEASSIVDLPPSLEVSASP